MKHLILALLFLATSRAGAVPACFDAFDEKRTALSILEERESLDYDQTMKIINESLSREELARWRALISQNSEKVETKIRKQFEITHPRTEQEIFEQTAKLIRAHVEAEFKRNKVSSIIAVYLNSPIKNPELRQALSEHYTYLAAVAKELPEAKLEARDAPAYFFGRLLLSGLYDTQVRTYRALSRNDELLKIAVGATPETLRSAIGKKLRIETGVRWTLQHFVNLKLAIFAAAGLTVALEQHASQTKIDELMKNDPRGKIMSNVTPEVAILLGRTPVENAQKLIEDLATRPMDQASQAEIDFIKEVAKEIGTKP